MCALVPFCIFPEDLANIVDMFGLGSGSAPMKKDEHKAGKRYRSKSVEVFPPSNLSHPFQT